MSVIGFLILAALAVFFVFAPKLGVGRVKSVDAEAVQKELLLERLDEISADSSDQQSELATDIAADLSQKRSAVGEKPEVTSKATINRSLLVLAIAIPIFGFVLYNSLIDSDRNELRGAEVVLTLDAQSGAEELEHWRVRLENYLAGHSDDGQVQFLLGQVYLKQTKYDLAATAFARTYEVSPGDLNVRVYWLQSRFLAARGRLDDVSRNLADEILSDSPNLPIVLEILALDAVAIGQPDQAVAYLNRSLAGLRDPARIVSLVAAITELRKQFQSPGIDVRIESSVEVPHAATLFVVARPVGGGMPYAVVRRPAMLLPLSVRLDDLVSMSEMRTLSSAAEYEVVVRLSRSGQAIAQPEDWQWISAPIVQGDGADLAPREPLQAMLAPPSN